MRFNAQGRNTDDWKGRRTTVKREMKNGEPIVTRGQVAQYFGISKNALRNYEEMDLVIPQIGENSYRYYQEGNVSTVSAIRMYRNMGFQLPDVKALLECDDNDGLDRMLREHQRALLEQQEEILHEMAQTCAMLERIKRATVAPFIEEERQPVCLLWRDNIGDACKAGSVDAAWVQAMPEVLIGGILNFSEDRSQLVSVECGLGIRQEVARKIGLTQDERVRKYELNHYIHAITSCYLEEGEYILSDYRPLFDYAQAHGLSTENRIFTHTLSSCRIHSERPLFTLEMWLPIEN